MSIALWTLLVLAASFAFAVLVGKAIALGDPAPSATEAPYADEIDRRAS